MLKHVVRRKALSFFGFEAAHKLLGMLLLHQVILKNKHQLFAVLSIRCSTILIQNL